MPIISQRSHPTQHSHNSLCWMRCEKCIEMYTKFEKWSDLSQLSCGELWWHIIHCVRKHIHHWPSACIKVILFWSLTSSTVQIYSLWLFWKGQWYVSLYAAGSGVYSVCYHCSGDEQQCIKLTPSQANTCYSTTADSVREQWDLLPSWSLKCNRGGFSAVFTRGSCEWSNL